MEEKNESELYDINIQKDYFNNLVRIIEDYLKYIISYNSLTKDYYKNLQIIQKNYDEKIKTTKNELHNNNKNINFSHLFLIISSMPSINNSYLDNLKFFIKGMNNSITALQKYIEEKKLLIAKFLNNLDDSKKDLLIKINNIEKEKNLYFNNLSLTEKAVSEFYMNKLKIEEISKNNDNNNSIDLKNLFIQNNSLEEQMNKTINETKNIENDYKLIISNSKIFKKAYIDSSNIAYENIQGISYELFNEIKKFIQNTIILLKNCYAIPLRDIDNNLSKIILKKEEDNKILNKIFAKCNIKTNDKYPIISKKYQLQIFNKSTNNNPFIKIEDGLEEIRYIENDLHFYIAKTMLSSFTLIENDYNIDFEIEEQKNTTKKITSNLLLNIEKKTKKTDSKKINKINENKELKYLHENDIELLYTLLDKHYNRVIFLQTISLYRTSGKYCIPEPVFEVVGKCLTIIINTVIRDEDYHYAKSAIILSQTYFTMRDGERFYLHNSIKNHELFSNIKFWEKTLEISIEKELLKNQKNKNNKKNKNVEISEQKEKDKDKDEKQELNNEKYKDIAFGQIASIVNSMIDFDINIKDIRSIIDSNVKLYKLNQNHKNNIELIIENKLNLNENDDMIEINNNNIINNEVDNNINKNEKNNNINNNELNNGINNDNKDNKKNNK